MRVPLVTCAFRGCGWKGQHEQELSVHLIGAHLDTFKGVCESVPARDYVAYYYQAIALRERSAVPVVGMPIDRRTVNIVSASFNDDHVRGLVCFVCARKKVCTSSRSCHRAWRLAARGDPYALSGGPCSGAP